MHTDSERTTKHPKNKQDHPAMSDPEASNDEDRKPAASTTPTPDGAPSSTCPSNDEDRKPAATQATPTPDGVPSTCAGFKRKSTSTRTGSVVSTSGQGIKLEPVIKAETVPAPETAPASPSTEQAEDPIPTEAVSNGPNLNPTVTVSRKVAKRTDHLYIAPPPPPPNITVPLPPTPQAEDIPVTQEPRIEEPLPTITVTEKAARGIAAPDILAGLPSPDTPLRSATVGVSTRLRSRRQTQLPPTETSDVELDDSDAFDDDYVDNDDGDLSGPVPPPIANVNISTRHRSSRRTGTPVPPPPATLNAPTRRRSSRSVIPTCSSGTPSAAATTRRRSSRCVIPTSSSGTPIPPPTATVDAPTLRQSRSRRQIQLPLIETREAELDDSDAFDDGDGDLPRTSWEGRLSELADYRKINGHCNVPQRYSENIKLGKWVGTQRSHYKLHLEGKTSPMTALRIQALESVGFEFDGNGTAWEGRLSELADYRKINGHCNVPQRNSENIKLGKWVGTQRNNYKLHLEGKTSPMTALRIQALESVGVKWNFRSTAWEDRLSELADYRKIYGHCNVPKCKSECTKLAKWVSHQRSNYKLHLEGKTSSMMTLSRIQELERLGFEWKCQGAAWEVRLSELADYRKLHGHCNVPRKYVQNSKLYWWVAKQRTNYRLHLEAKPSRMTLSRIQALERLGFE
jgi:hypothetical protein